MSEKMSNEYFLRMGAIGSFPKVEIDKEHFEKLKMAEKILSNALSIEQIYAIVVNNFLELERENAARSSNVSGSAEYKDAFEIQLALNIRIINFLTAVRLYRDQLLRHVSACTPFDENTKVDIKEFFAQEYDTIFQYRFMEELRNHIQHRGVPVHMISINAKRTEPGEEVDKGLSKYSLFFYARKEELRLAKKFKKKVLNKMPEKINLLVTARIYVEAISRIHEQVRKKIKESVESARVNFDDAISEYRSVYTKDLYDLLCALEYQDKRKTSEVLIITKWDDVRKMLVIKNKKLLT